MKKLVLHRRNAAMIARVYIPDQSMMNDEEQVWRIPSRAKIQDPRSESVVSHRLFLLAKEVTPPPCGKDHDSTHVAPYMHNPTVV
jgi:hypothetical protein